MGEEGSLAALLDSPDVRTVDRTLGYECLTGGQVDATWRGVPVADLVDAVGLPGETTHLVVESRDGYRSCVEVRVAVEGLLAFERDGDRLDGPRFLAPAIEGPRAVKDVVALRPVSLDPDEDRAAYEGTGDDGADGV
ncbi:molybdopterin-dependent oxidoreductase [Haloarchaeobius sp. HRN-SO-5]|uniref:molybdopterin-dependent oxidoreductase n=1 Tax=Haloarchaeobius sp. HRN-SO-5 TaxID=3446118 RepID=UPI003EB80663